MQGRSTRHQYRVGPESVPDMAYKARRRVRIGTWITRVSAMSFLLPTRICREKEEGEEEGEGGDDVEEEGGKRFA
eukprot:461247-Rhodomonas_salina.2